ncbi:hypothetical protein F5141DRAFT_1113421 [Pisolithus sp. B1]|nr:hypothetical protein F5141DRAFT_1113421 [Pisolithus sp. B1]
METISQLESNRLSAKVIIPLYNDEEQYEFLLTVHLRSSHVTLRFDSHIYTERAASPVLGCLHLAGGDSWPRSLCYDQRHPHCH